MTRLLFVYYMLGSLSTSSLFCQYYTTLNYSIIKNFIFINTSLLYLLKFTYFEISIILKNLMLKNRKIFKAIIILVARILLCFTPFPSRFCLFHNRHNQQFSFSFPIFLPLISLFMAFISNTSLEIINGFYRGHS